MRFCLGDYWLHETLTHTEREKKGGREKGREGGKEREVMGDKGSEGEY